VGSLAQRWVVWGGGGGHFGSVVGNLAQMCSKTDLSMLLPGDCTYVFSAAHRPQSQITIPVDTSIRASYASSSREDSGIEMGNVPPSSDDTHRSANAYRFPPCSA
jgi:hypothetical protein